MDIPAGWKLVPINPTARMLKAARTVLDDNRPYPDYRFSVKEKHVLRYRAMINQAPEPPKIK